QLPEGQPYWLKRRLRLGRWLFRKAIWSARMLRLERIRCSTQLGRKGTASSGIDACCGVRPPLRELQWKQAETTFSQMSRPPCDSGSTWSRVSCWRLQSRPEYRHRCWSRANSAALVSAGVGSSACARAWPRRSEEHTSELQSRENLVCRLLLE